MDNENVITKLPISSIKCDKGDKGGILETQQNMNLIDDQIDGLQHTNQGANKLKDSLDDNQVILDSFLNSTIDDYSEHSLFSSVQSDTSESSDLRGDCVLKYELLMNKELELINAGLDQEQSHKKSKREKIDIDSIIEMMYPISSEENNDNQQNVLSRLLNSQSNNNTVMLDEVFQGEMREQYLQFFNSKISKKRQREDSSSNEDLSDEDSSKDNSQVQASQDIHSQNQDSSDSDQLEESSSEENQFEVDSSDEDLPEIKQFEEDSSSSSDEFSLSSYKAQSTQSGQIDLISQLEEEVIQQDDDETLYKREKIQLNNKPNDIIKDTKQKEISQKMQPQNNIPVIEVQQQIDTEVYLKIQHNLKKFQPILSKDEFNLCVQELKKREYIIEKFLAQGGGGIVLEGKHFKSFEKVAIKIMKSYNSLESLEEYKKEKDILDNIKCHQFIISIYEHFILEDIHVSIQVMELCERDLESEINSRKNKNPISVFHLNKIFYHLIHALIEIHINNIIHFDIKPENILITANGQYKLTDFGISHLLKESEKYCDESYGLTLKYSSPEQYNWSEEKPVQQDSKSDIYSMGFVFLRLLNAIFNPSNLRQGNWNGVKVLPQYQSYLSFIRYNMCQKDPLQRKSAIELLQVQHSYMIIEQNNVPELVRIITLLHKFKDIDIKESKYKQFLVMLKAKLLTQRKIDTNNQVIAIKELLKLTYQKYNNINHEDVAQVLMCLAQCYLHIGKIQKSQNVYLVAYRMIKSVHNSADKCNLKLIEPIQQIAHTYFMQRKYEQSLSYFQQALNIYIDFNYDEDNPLILHLKNDIASCYQQMGEYEISLEMYLQNQEKIRKIYSKESIEQITILVNIGNMQQTLGQPNQALNNCKLAFTMAEKYYQLLHTPSFATIYILYSKIAIDLDLKEGALLYSKECKKRIKKQLNCDYSLLIQSQIQLAKSFACQGKLKKALKECMIASNSIIKNRLPKIDLAEVYTQMGDIYSQSLKIKKSQKYYTKAFEIYITTYQQDTLEYNIHSAQYQVSYGNTYLFSEQYEEAEKYYEQNLSILKQIFSSEKHYQFAMAYIYLGQVNQKLKKLSQAKEYYQKSLEILNHVAKGDQKDKIQSLNGIGIIFTEENQPKDALLCHKQALEMCKNIYELNNKYSASTLFLLASAYYYLKEYNKVISLLKESIYMIKSITPKDRYTLQKVYQMIGESYEAMSEYNQSIIFYLKSYTKLKKLDSKDLDRKDRVLLYAFQIYTTHPNIAYELKMKQLDYFLKLELKDIPSEIPLLSQAHAFMRLSQNLPNTFYEQELSLKALEIYENIQEPDCEYYKLLFQIGHYYNFREMNYDKGIPFLKKAIDMILKNKQIDYVPFFSQIYQFLSVSHQKKKDFTKALEYRLKASDLYSIKNKENQNQALWQLSFASLYYEMGDYEIAYQCMLEYLSQQQSQDINYKATEELLNKFNELLFVQSSSESTFIDYNQKLLSLLENFPNYLTFSAPNEQLVMLRMKVLATVYQKNNDRNLLYAICLLNVSNCLETTQNAISLKLCQQALKIFENIQPNHLCSISCLHQIGKAYMEQEDYQLAARYYSQTVDVLVNNKLTQFDDEFKMNVYQNLISCYEKINDKNSSFESYLSLLSIQERIFVQNSQVITNTLMKLSVLYLQLNNAPEALKYNLRCLEMRKSLDMGYFPYLETLWNLFLVYLRIPDEENALKISSEYFNTCFKSKNDELIAGRANDLRNTLDSLNYSNNKSNEKTFQLDILEKQRNIFKVVYLNLIEQHMHLSDLLENHEDSRTREENLNILKRDVETLKSVYNKEDFAGNEKLSQKYHHIYKRYQLMSNVEEQIKYQELYYQTRKLVYSHKDHIDIAESLMILGNLYLAQNDKEKAQNFYKQSILMYTNLNEKHAYDYMQCIAYSSAYQLLINNYQQAYQQFVKINELDIFDIPKEVLLKNIILLGLQFVVQEIKHDQTVAAIADVYEKYNNQ